jgi:hypothetical protein
LTNAVDLVLGLVEDPGLEGGVVAPPWEYSGIQHGIFRLNKSLQHPRAKYCIEML